MKVLVSGGSGFIGAHCVDTLLSHGHEVVTTVRSHDKGKFLVNSHKGKPLSYVIVEDIANPDAFNEAVKAEPGFDAVLHTASPFHFNVTDPKKDLLDPAIIGTTGILKAIKASAPSVKRVAITSSFAAIVNPQSHPKKYDESVWNGITEKEAIETPPNAYRASKTFAEKAAWDFVEKEKPGFTLTTLNPPFVFGPVVHYLNNLDSMNTSNQRFLGAIQGKFKDELPPTGTWLWVDVRDIALAHVRAIENEKAQGHRFFVTAGYWNNAEMIEIIRKNFPEYADKLPPPEKTKSDMPKDIFEIDNSRSKQLLGLDYMTLEKCVVDTIKSFKEAGA